MLGLGTSILFGSVSSVENSIISSLKKRVFLDGGLIESPSCIDASFDLIDDQDSDINILRSFEARVFQSGGTAESGTCVLTEVRSLTPDHSLKVRLLRKLEDRVMTDGGTFESNTCALDAIEDLI
jgi:hypothetical protein